MPTLLYRYPQCTGTAKTRKEAQSTYLHEQTPLHLRCAARVRWLAAPLPVSRPAVSGAPLILLCVTCALAHLNHNVCSSASWRQPGGGATEEPRAGRTQRALSAPGTPRLAQRARPRCLYPLVAKSDQRDKIRCNKLRDKVRCNKLRGKVRCPNFGKGKWLYTGNHHEVQV